MFYSESADIFVILGRATVCRWQFAYLTRCWRNLISRNTLVGHTDAIGCVFRISEVKFSIRWALLLACNFTVHLSDLICRIPIQIITCEHWTRDHGGGGWRRRMRECFATWTTFYCFTKQIICFQSYFELLMSRIANLSFENLYTKAFGLKNEQKLIFHHDIHI